jgi:hypothetical protein
MERRKELVKRLREVKSEDHKKVLARFAIEYGLREQKVYEYYMMIKKAGYLETDANGNYLPASI